MQLKKLLALLLSAALALSLLAGCGGESVARSLLALLDGKYANVSVEMDPDLEADLRQAIRTAESENAGDDAAVIRAALETLLGSKVTFRKLGEGQQGDTAFDLIFYAGADPDKAAQSAYSQWNGTFSNLPDDGLYTAALAQVQTENGVWLLVQATVDKAGTVDKPDKDDDEPEDPGYTVDEKGNYTVNASNGLQNLFDTLESDALSANIILKTDQTVTGTFGDVYNPFTGTLQSADPNNKVTITLAGGKGLFVQIGEDNSGPENNGTVENITFEVQTDITDTYADSSNHFAGAVAGVNYGTITNCDVTISSGCTIQTGSSPSLAAAGGLVGLNYGTITDCTVTINGSIQATGTTAGARASAGGLAGQNVGTGTVDGTCSFESNDLEKTITAQAGSDKASVPDSDDSDKDRNLNTDTKGYASAGAKIGDNNGYGPVG